MSNKFHLFALISTHMHLVLQQHDAKSRSDQETFVVRQVAQVVVICCITSRCNLQYNIVALVVLGCVCVNLFKTYFVLHKCFMAINLNYPQGNI